MQWQDAIRMNPRQVLFLLTPEDQAKNAARNRNMRAAGKTPSGLTTEHRKRMAELRKRYANVDSKDQL